MVVPLLYLRLPYLCVCVCVQSVAEELEGFEQLFHQYLLDRKASASTVTWDKIESLPDSAVSGGEERRGEGVMGVEECMCSGCGEVQCCMCVVSV